MVDRCPSCGCQWVEVARDQFKIAWGAKCVEGHCWSVEAEGPAGRYFELGDQVPDWNEDEP
jgi:hypothetical protein